MTSAEGLNVDYSVCAIMHSNKMEWTPSPHPKVIRKRFELYGPTEAGRVTSIVQYLPDSSFHSHGHPEGEEILVLEGIFEDEHGCYPEGSYLLNPEGFEHQPFSKDGCLLLVKLRQFPGTDKNHVFINTKAEDIVWSPISNPIEYPGVLSLTLYENKIQFEKISLIKLKSSSDLPLEAHVTENDISADTNELFLFEVFVTKGKVAIDDNELERYSWFRNQWKEMKNSKISALEDSTFYMKIGTRDIHLKKV